MTREFPATSVAGARPMTVRRAVLLATAVLLVASTEAHAVEVRSGVELYCEDTFCAKYAAETPRQVLTAQAAPGEQADVVVRPVDGALRFEERSAPLTAGAGCAAVTEQAVECALGPHPLLRVTLLGGTGADRLAVGGDLRAPFVVLSGGAGDDVLQGSSGAERLNGGAGADAVAGGGGDDRVFASTVDQDRLDGGDGLDELSFAAARRPVHADLAAKTAARSTVLGFEHLVGGVADDVLRGSSEAERLDGGGGRDFLDGRGGDDRLELEDGAPDRAMCGAGRDRISTTLFDDGYGDPYLAASDAFDVVASDCELAVTEDPNGGLLRRHRIGPHRLRGGVLELARPCRRCAIAGVRLRATPQGRPLARRRFAGPTLRIELPRRLRRADTIVVQLLTEPRIAFTVARER